MRIEKYKTSAPEGAAVQCLLFFLLQIEFRLCSCSQAADVLVVTGNDEDACGCHNDKGKRVTASDCKERYGEKHRKAHRCHRHKTDGKENGYKNREADKSCAPIHKPNACKECHNGFSAFEIVPNGECVAKHTAKKCHSGGKLPCSISVLHYEFCKENGENGFANVDCHYTKGCGGKAMKSFKIGKAGVFATELSDILFINQAREDDSTVYAAKQISEGGKCQTIEI